MIAVVKNSANRIEAFVQAFMIIEIYDDRAALEYKPESKYK